MKREPLFYEEQSKALSTFISCLGMTLSVIFSIGAMIGAMITMYASVSNRTAEIGTLRALGFRRLVDPRRLPARVDAARAGRRPRRASLFASFLQAFTITTMNWQSFASSPSASTSRRGIVGVDAAVLRASWGSSAASCRACGPRAWRSSIRCGPHEARDRILATYRITRRQPESRARAEALATEQSVEMPVAAIGDERILDEIVATRRGDPPARRTSFDVVLGIAPATTGNEA